MASRGRPRSFPLDAGWWADDDVPAQGGRPIFQVALEKLSCGVLDVIRRDKLAHAARTVTTWTQAVSAIVGTMHSRADDGREKADLLVAFVALVVRPERGLGAAWRRQVLSSRRLPKAREIELRDAARTRKASEIARLIQMWRYGQPDLAVRAMSKAVKSGQRRPVDVFIHR